MNTQTDSATDIWLDSIHVGFVPMYRVDGSWSDGTDEQEDELENVQKGILNPPTNDEGPGEIFESNKTDAELEKSDEQAEVDTDAKDELKNFPGFRN